MTNLAPTPETEHLLNDVIPDGVDMRDTLIDFACKLERERNELRAIREQNASCISELIGIADAMREAIKEARDAIIKLQDNGHHDSCKWLNFANAKCDCGVDAADNTIAKLKPFITTP